MSKNDFSGEDISSSERREFLDTIRHFRRRIELADLLDKLVSAMLIGAGAGIFFQAASFVLPFYYVNFCTAVALLLAVPSAFAAALLRRCSMERAALTMDSFGFQERIVTAYEHLDEKGAMAKLQRGDAMRQLREQKEKIRIPLRPSRKKLAGLAGILLLLPALALIPSAVKEQAKEMHLLKQEAREKEEEIEEVLEGLEELAEQELTEEQLAALQEMMDSLNASLEEYRQAASAEAMAAAQTKLDFKYANMGSELSRLAESLQGGAAVSVAAAGAMQEMARKLQQMSGTASPEDGGMLAGGGKGTGDGSGSSPGNGEGNHSGDGSDGGQGNGSGDGTGDGSGDGTGNGSGDGTGDGSGDGTGNGSGDSQGDGSGGTQGEGGGSGPGRGEGSSSAAHDYVSVPNAIADSGSLTGNADGHDDSAYFRDQNGLSWEGVHVSHDAVIGSYRERAYEGIAAGRYPEGMEDVIKDYFSSFN